MGSKKKYEEIVSNLNGVILTDFDFEQNEEVNFKYIVASKLMRSEKLILGIVQKKVIVKPSYLDSCKKAKKWLGSEPFCWNNDEKLLSFIPSDGTECKIKDKRIKDQVDIVQAIQSWQRNEENVFYAKKIFIWVPNGRSNTYSKILRAHRAHVYSINTAENEEFDQQKLLRQCKEINVEIDEVYLENDEKYNKELYKSMRKALALLGKYWSTEKQVACYDTDYILDWTLEGSVFEQSDVKKEEYRFEI